MTQEEKDHETAVRDSIAKMVQIFRQSGMKTKDAEKKAREIALEHQKNNS